MRYNSFELKEISWGERKLSVVRHYKMKLYNCRQNGGKNEFIRGSKYQKDIYHKIRWE